MTTMDDGWPEPRCPLCGASVESQMIPLDWYDSGVVAPDGGWEHLENGVTVTRCTSDGCDWCDEEAY